MAKTRKLVMNFGNETGKETTITIARCAAFVSGDDVEEAMQTMIDSPARAPRLTAKKKAYVEETERTELYSA